MPDTSGWAGDWRVALAGVLAVLSAGTATLVLRDADPATQSTVVTDVVQAHVVVDGRRVTATEGMDVPTGASVVTAAGGSATLRTGDREVYLGEGTAVTVTDGVTQSLDGGLVMVDGRDAARLTLTTRAGSLAVAKGALTRVETEVALRVGVFEGEARMTAAGRRATTDIPALHQLRTPYGGLPGAPTVLALKGDKWEQLLAADLVAADADLNSLAKGLDNDKGRIVLAAAPVSLRTSVVRSTTPGEQALAVAVAQAAASPAEESLGRVQEARRQGGSWGVVAALVQARVSDVSALLDAVLQPGAQPPPRVAGPDTGLGGLLSPTPTPGRSPSPSRGPGGGPSPTTTARPTAPPSSNSPSPTTAVDDVITTVQNVIGPSASPSARAGGILPLP